MFDELNEDVPQPESAFDQVDEIIPLSQRNIAQDNPTLALVLGQTGGYDKVRDDIAVRGYGPSLDDKFSALVEENKKALRAQFDVFAKQGDAINSQVAAFAISNVDKVAASATETEKMRMARVEFAAKLAKVASANKWTEEETMRFVEKRSNDLAIAQYIGTYNTEPRNPVLQFGRELLGVQGVENAAQITPAINEALGLSFTEGSVNLTSSVKQIRDKMAVLPLDEQKELLSRVMTKVEDTAGPEGRTILAQRLQQSIDEGISPADWVFDGFDLVDVPFLIAGVVGASVKLSKGARLLAKGGGEGEAISGLMEALRGGSSVMGDKGDAVIAAISARAIPDLEGLAPAMQASIKADIEANLRKMRDSLYTGGATTPEVLATLKHIEASYSPDTNPSIRSSNVGAQVDQGNIRVEATYGDGKGAIFPTKEEALAHHEAFLRGDVEAVRVSVARDLSAKIAEAQAKLDDLGKQLTNAKKMGVTSKGPTGVVTNVKDSSVAIEAAEAARDTAQMDWMIKNGELQDARLRGESPEAIARLEAEDDAAFKLTTQKQVEVDNLKAAQRKLPGRVEEPYVRPGGTVMFDTLDDAWNDLIARGHVSPMSQTLYDTVKKFLPKGKLEIARGTESAQTAGSASPGYFRIRMEEALWDNGTNSVGMNAAEVLLHESMHIATVARLKANPALAAKFDDLRDVVRKHILANPNPDSGIDFRQRYLSSNEWEFAVGAFDLDEGRAFMKVLDSIPYKTTTALSRLYELLKQVFNIPKKDTALAEWMGLTEELMGTELRVMLNDQREVIFPGVTFSSGVGRVEDPVKVAKKAERIKNLENAIAATAEEIDMMKSIDGTPEEGWVIKQVLDLPVFQKDIGAISTADMENLHHLLGKANPRLRTASSLYSDAMASMLKGFKASKMYSQIVKDGFDKLSKVEVLQVEDVLREGDLIQAEFTPKQLAGKGLNEAQQEAYIRYRAMRNILWQHKEEAYARTLMSKGYRFGSIRTVDSEGADVHFKGPAKELTINNFQGKKVWDVTNKKYVSVTEDMVKLQGGSRVIEFMQAQEFEGKNITRFLVPDSGYKMGDIKQSIGYVPGSFSRVYTDEFWIKAKGSSDVDGETKAFSKALRTAKSQKEAQAYIEKLKLVQGIRLSGKPITEDVINSHLGKWEVDASDLVKGFESGRYDNVTFEWNYNRLDDNYLRSTVGTGDPDLMDGQTFWSGRGENAIKSISSDKPAIENPLKALEMELNNVARYTSAHEWRTNAIQRWYNTFAHILAKEDMGDPESAFFAFANREPVSFNTDPIYKQVRDQHAFILAQISQRTYDEKLFDQALLDYMSWMEDIPALSRFPAFIRNVDVPSFLKSTASSMLLGAFNFSQLIVQASGASIAVLASPMHGLKATTMAAALRKAALSDNPDVARFMAKGMGVDVGDEEFIRIQKAIQRTGLIDRVRAASTFGGINENTPLSKQHWLAEKHMHFFNYGEEWAKVTAFDIARREFIEKYPGKVWDDNEGLKAILLRADDLTSNMNSANRQQWAKGFVGVPMQFLTYSINQGVNFAAAAKGAITGKGSVLSGKDLVKMYFGGYALFGVNNMATPDIVETWMGENFSDLPEEAKFAITQGLPAAMLDLIAQAITGEEMKLALGSRLSPLQWYEDVADFIMSGADASLLEEAFGPSGALFRAAKNGMEHIGSLFVQDTVTPGEFGRRVLLAASGLTSSLSNAEKAYFAYQAQGKLYSKSGDLQDVMTTNELIAKALGISSNEATESGQTFKLSQDHKTYIKKTGKVIGSYMMAAQRAKDSGDMEAYKSNTDAALGIYYSHTHWDMKELRSYIFKAPEFDTQIREYAIKHLQGTTERDDKLFVNDPWNKPESE